MASNDAKSATIHLACRSDNPKKLIEYQVGENEKPVIRPYIPRHELNWEKNKTDYKPIIYTSPLVLSNPPWADPQYPSPDTKWNSLDGDVDRKSHLGKYLVIGGLPRNPVGRTGISGRGLLGRWGPNHAADPIVTRWKIDSDGKHEISTKTKKKILQFVTIQRVDTGEWAIPGGMCDPGEKISNTMKREFMEEALNSNDITEDELNDFKNKLSLFFGEGVEVYRGYVDDPRNTDNAWIETVAYNFHDEDDIFKNINLIAGDDAKHVKWVDIDSNLKLYANHKEFIHQVAKKHNAHW